MSEAPDYTLPPEEPEFTASELDIIISAVLRVGLVSACVVMLVGLFVHFSHGPVPLPALHTFHSEPDDLRSIAGIWRLALHGDGLGLMQGAALILLATPFLRVIFAVYGFARQRDYKFVVVSLIVLTALIVGLYAGHATD
jgi:uncharacterized membrane protein